MRVLGSSGTYPVPGRPAAGLVVEEGSTRVWCDAGPGTFTALWEILDLDLLTAVVVSHQHPDHCLDLLTAFHALAYGPAPREGIPVFAPAATIERISGFLDAGQRERLERTFSFQPVADGDRRGIGELAVTFAETDHPVPTVASRWEAGGRSLAYTADTGPRGDWPRLAAGAHVLVSEAALQIEPRPELGHLTATQAGSVAREAGVGELILTHIPPHLDVDASVAEAERTFGRPVRLAVPGATVEV